MRRDFYHEGRDAAEAYQALTKTQRMAFNNGMSSWWDEHDRSEHEGVDVAGLVLGGLYLIIGIGIVSYCLGHSSGFQKGTSDAPIEQTETEDAT